MPLAALIDVASRHQVYLEGLKTHEQKATVEFLRTMDKDIRRRLGGVKLTDFSRARLEQLIVQVNKDIAVVMGTVETAVADSALALAEYEAGYEIRALNQVVDVEFVLPTSAQLATAVFSRPMDIQGLAGKDLLKPFLKGLTATAKNRMANEIRAGYYQGETTAKILQRVRGTRAAGFKDGVIGRTGRDINTAVRTALQHSATQARQAVYAKNPEVVDKIRIVATLDSKTSTICRGLDGREFELDKGPRPPFHPNCRSTITAVLNEKYAALGKGRTRSSRDSEGNVVPVPANQTYYGWLKTQPAAFQNSAIGPVRGKLLRDGGLSAQRFQELQLSKNFAPLTLEQMRRLEPVAFGKAGIKESLRL